MEKRKGPDTRRKCPICREDMRGSDTTHYRYSQDAAVTRRNKIRVTFDPVILL